MTLLGTPEPSLIQLAKEVEEAPIIAFGSLKTGEEFIWVASRRMWRVNDARNNYGYGATLLDAIAGMMNNRRVGFTPFKEWVGNELVST